MTREKKILLINHIIIYIGFSIISIISFTFFNIKTEVELFVFFVVLSLVRILLVYLSEPLFKKSCLTIS
ncbi:hypothetical protein SAMN04488700_2041 [Carnobacterium iners]|uniref:Uncharacterized protein n=1 Tax=Carnobacterium iners TaxID=1073423 RepID=A0A1X7NIW6_9LACT|nr:hypothetical protein SAMN04488114_10873 [Carnobacterium iners]SMH37765.1 hypothetical protein SAMN04488700_2041 [Carnobacterium iners]